jgi:adhesin/invasin
MTRCRMLSLLTVFVFILSARNAKAGTATQLAITDINGGAPAIAFTPYSVTIEAQDSSGNPANVVTDTTVFLMYPFSDFFQPLGQLEGVIKAGTNSVTLPNALSNGNGGLFIAAAASGDALAPSGLRFFSIYGGKAAALSLFLDTSIRLTPSAQLPFTVIINIRDASGNLARVSQDTAVTLYLNSGTGILSGNITTVIPAGSDFGEFNVSYSKAESNVSVVACATSGDALALGVIAPFSVAGAPTSFSVAFAPVGYFIPTQGTTAAPFLMTVSSTDSAGLLAYVDTDTSFTLARGQGTGNLGGEITGTIPAGSGSTTVALTYNVAESNVTIVATGTSGENLAPFTTAPFNVAGSNPAIPTQLSVYTSGFFAECAGVPFSLIVEPITTDGNFATVTTDTTIHLSVTSGTGQLFGEVDGIIPIGQSYGYFPVTYNTIETNVIFTATVVSGDNLAPGSSSPVSFTGFANQMSSSFPSSLTVGVPFDLTLTASYQSFSPFIFTFQTAVGVDTPVTITQQSGTGTLSGTLTGMLPAGQTKCIIHNLSYNKAETISVKATAGALASMPSLTFTAPATKLSATAIAQQTAGRPFSVIVNAADSSNAAANVNADTTVTLSVFNGNGTLNGITSNIIPQGKSTTTISGVIYDRADTGVILTIATTTGQSFTSIQSSAFDVLAATPVGPPAQLDISQGNGQSAATNASVPIAPSVLVRDVNSIPLSGVTVTFSTALGVGHVTGGTAITDASGYATVGNWTLGLTPGVNFLTASAAGLVKTVAFTAHVTGAAGQITLSAGDTQSATAWTPVTIAPAVLVIDGAGNPASGITVTFAVATGGGSITGATQTTGADGIATLGSWTLGTAVGANTLTATAADIATPVTFTATALSPATHIAIHAGDQQSATAGDSVTIAPSVIITDKNGNPVAGELVTFAVGLGGGSITGATQTTGADGIATLGGWTLGSAVGANSLTATAADIATPVTFTATTTAIVVPPAPLTLTSGPTATPVAVLVGDAVQFACAVNLSGSTFTWNFADGTTDTSGAAPTHVFTSPGTYTVTVTIVNGAQTVSGSVSVMVSAPAVISTPPIVGAGPDSDGDGFSDTVEVAMGTNPHDATSLPFPLNGATPAPLTGVAISAKLNFSAANKDKLTVSGTIPWPAGVTAPSGKLALIIGDFIRVFDVDAKGHSKIGGEQVLMATHSSKHAPATSAKFNIKISNENIAQAFAAFGLTNAAAKKKPVTIPVTLTFASTAYSASISEHYSAIPGKGGATSR